MAKNPFPLFCTKQPPSKGRVGEKAGEDFVSRRLNAFLSEGFHGRGAVKPAGAQHLEPVGVEVHLNVRSSPRGRIVAVLQGVYDRLADRGDGVFRDLAAQAVFADDARPAHVPLHERERFRENVRDGADQFLGVDVPKSRFRVRRLGRPRKHREDDFEAGKEALRKDPGGEKARKRRTQNALDSLHGPELDQNGFVRKRAENARGLPTDPRENALQDFWIEFLHRGFGHRLGVEPGLPTEFQETVDFVGREMAVSVARSNEGALIATAGGDEAGLQMPGRFGNARHHKKSVFKGDLLNLHAYDGRELVACDLHFRVSGLRVESFRGREAVSLGEAQNDHPAVEVRESGNGFGETLGEVENRFLDFPGLGVASHFSHAADGVDHFAIGKHECSSIFRRTDGFFSKMQAQCTPAGSLSVRPGRSRD